MELFGKRVLLTGASGGIGRELATQLAARGAILCLSGRERGRLQELAGILTAQGAETEIFPLDLERMEDCGLPAKHGTFDVLINNAGLLHFGEFAAMSESELERLYRTNMLAPLLLTRACLPAMLAQRKGWIVNVGSIFGSLGFGYFSAYCASKFGLRGFSQALRRELRGSGVKVIYVALRAVNTPMNDARMQAFNQATHAKTDEPAWVAEQIIKALVNERTETCLGGMECFFAKLNGLLPDLLDRALTQTMQQAKRFSGTS